MKKINLKSLTISGEMTMLGALKKLNKSLVKTLFIVSKKKSFLGTLTDGDIRRNLIRGNKIKTKLKLMVKQKYLSFSQDVSRAKAFEKMKKKAIKVAPILDKKKKLISFLILDENYKNIKNKLIIMAGGKGKRLLPLTKKVPKSMLRLNNKPILEHLIMNAKREGFSQIILSVNHLGNVIKKYLKQKRSFGVTITYINEKKPLGTCGSLSLLKKIPKEPIIVCNGDIVSEIRFSDLLNYHYRNKADVTMVVKPHEIQNPFGVVKVNNKNNIVEIEEKPFIKSNINVGAYVLSNKVLKHLKKNQRIDMTDFIALLIKKNRKISAYPIYESWKDIGYPIDLKTIQNEFRKKNIGS